MTNRREAGKALLMASISAAALPSFGRVGAGASDRASGNNVAEPTATVPGSPLEADVKPTILNTLARFAVDTDYNALPELVRKCVRYTLLDSFGCAIAGTTVSSGHMPLKLAERLGGPEECTIIGGGRRVASSNAVFANGQLINALDFDALCAGHVTPYAIPPALALAEINNRSGKDLVAAIAVAFEIAIRMTKSVPMAGIDKVPPKTNDEIKASWTRNFGFSCYNLGPAAGAGKMLNLDAGKIAHAMGIAGHLTQVPMVTRHTWASPRANTKYCVPGWQNTGALMAALLAQEGFIGDVTLVDDEQHGFWRAAGYAGWFPGVLSQEMGTTWSFVPDVTYKYFPACGIPHTLIRQFIDLIETNKLQPEDIEHVMLLAHPNLEMRAFQDRSLTSVVDIQFGAPYLMALAANRVPIGADWQRMEIVDTPRIRAFAAKVDMAGHPDYAQTKMNSVAIKARGQTFAQAYPELRFTPIVNMDEAVIVEKFHRNVNGLISKAQADKVIALTLKLEDVTNINELTRLLRA